MAFEAEKGHLFSALAALLGALLIQIGTNLSNDYFDFVKGADTEERLGPARARAGPSLSSVSAPLTKSK